jgi:hypothetical protein
MLFKKRTLTSKKAAGWILLTAAILFFASISEAGSLDLDVMGTVSTAYDDNITLTDEDREKGVVSNLMAGLGLKQEGPTHLLDIKADVTQHLFWDQEEFNNVSTGLDLLFKKELSSSTRFRLTDTFSHSEEPRNFEDAFGRSSGRLNVIKNKAGLSLVHDLTSRVSGELHYNHALSAFSREDIEDSMVRNAGGEINYAYNSATIFKVLYDATQRTFENDADAVIFSPGIGLRRFFTEQLYLDLESGPDFIETFDGSSLTKPRYSATLTNDVNENTQLSLTYEKKYTTTDYVQDIFDSWRTFVKATRKITKRVDAFLSAFYGEGEYINSDVTEKLCGAQAGIHYAISQNIRAGVGYSFTDSDSDNDINDYQKNYYYAETSFLF